MTAANTRNLVNGSGSVDEDLTQRRRKEIALGACAVFDERGYASTRIADISAHLGIGQGTIYRYFTGKDDLMDHVIAHGVRRMLAAMREEPALSESADTAEQFTLQITAVTRRLLDMAADEQVLLRVLLIQAPAARPEAINQVTDQLSAATAAYLTRGVESGYLRTDLDVTVVADAMTGIAVPAMRRALTGQLDGQARASTARALGQLIAHGAFAP